MEAFLWDCNTRIATEWNTEPVRRAVDRFYRDMGFVLEREPEQRSQEGTRICLVRAREREPEWYRVSAESRDCLRLEAGDDLGAVYGLLYLSREYLGIQPFWFWMDQKLEKKDRVEIPFGAVEAQTPSVAFRGWFINDEVLISHWKGGVSQEYPWEMAMEALLRCGGNVVIPGTDRNARIYAPLASGMGLWISQHHAEPLGAEMFARAYPQLTASYQQHPELFQKLWREGIRRQKDQKVIWSLGFRGQGDVPFWENDPAYDTPESRGALISSLIQLQYEMVAEQVENPVCCVNLYGEVMELYQQGCLTLPENLIYVWADNGFGKMVSRRQWNHNPRIPALPRETEGRARHGMYYHASFYDLQAAYVLTMLPNSMEFVAGEVRNAYQRGIRDLWMINCSNVKPHVYVLDFLACLWKDIGADPKEHLLRFLRDYYGTASPELAACVEEYYRAAIAYGPHEDDHAGEQFYNDVLRVCLYHWMKDGGREACEEHAWCMPLDSFKAQMDWYGSRCGEGQKRFEALEERCCLAEQELSGEAACLWEDSLLLQVRIHGRCCAGAALTAKAYEAYARQDYWEAFSLLGQAAEAYDAACREMRGREHGKWKGFYENDAQADIGFTADRLRAAMGYVRNLGDGPYFYLWQRQVSYAPQDRKIMLLLSEEKRMTDWELYEASRR